MNVAFMPTASAHDFAPLVGGTVVGGTVGFGCTVVGVVSGSTETGSLHGVVSVGTAASVLARSAAFADTGVKISTRARYVVAPVGGVLSVVAPGLAGRRLREGGVARARNGAQDLELAVALALCCRKRTSSAT